MIGGAVLVVGLLLILAGLASARIPGGASFSPSGIAPARKTAIDGVTGPLGFARRVGNPIRAFLLSPIHPATWYANAAIGMGFFLGVFAFAFLVSLASAGFASLVVGVGLLLIAMTIEGARILKRHGRQVEENALP